MAPALPENVIIRRYEEKDRDEVCKLFWKGACVGEDSAMSIGLRNLHLQPISVVFYYLFATGIAIIYFQPAFPTFLPSSLALLPNTTYTGGALVFAAVAIVVSLRWRFRKTIWEGCKAAWKEDLCEELGKYYAFEKEVGVNERGLGDEGGVSGFWVAEATEQVRRGKELFEEKKVLVGCVGLDSRTQQDKSFSELRRFTVLPVERYKRQGIGKALLHEAVTHARKHKNASISNKNYSRVGLKKLVAIVSTYEPAAWGLLRANGWKIVGTEATSTFVRKVYDYKMVLEL